MLMYIMVVHVKQTHRLQVAQFMEKMDGKGFTIWASKSRLYYLFYHHMHSHVLFKGVVKMYSLTIWGITYHGEESYRSTKNR